MFNTTDIIQYLYNCCQIGRIRKIQHKKIYIHQSLKILPKNILINYDYVATERIFMYYNKKCDMSNYTMIKTDNVRKCQSQEQCYVLYQFYVSQSQKCLYHEVLNNVNFELDEKISYYNNELNELIKNVMNYSYILLPYCKLNVLLIINKNKKFNIIKNVSLKILQGLSPSKYHACKVVSKQEFDPNDSMQKYIFYFKNYECKGIY